ncbi:MAG: helix-hairpin-helix domain-containing protein [Enhygromyxa sp.]
MSNSIRNFARTLTLTVATLLGTSTMALASEPVNADTTQQSGKQLEGQININTASAAQLELLPGVGPATAKRIMDYRKDHPFQQRNHIMRIKGIGQKTFAKMKDFLVVEGETTLKLVK